MDAGLYREIGRRLRVRRKQLDQTQAQVANKLGISRASLANIETGRQSLLVHQLYALAGVLDWPLEQLLPLPLPPKAQNLPFSGSDLTPEQKNQIARLLQGTGSKLNPTVHTDAHQTQPERSGRKTNKEI